MLTFRLSLSPTVGLSLAMILPASLARALSAVLLGLALIEWTAPERDEAMSRRPPLGARLVAAGVMTGLALLGGGQNPTLLVILIALVLAVLVVIDVTGRLRQGGTSHPAENHDSDQNRVGPVSASP